MHLLHICDACHAVAHAQSRRPTHYNWLLINIVKSVGAWELCCYFKSCNSATPIAMPGSKSLSLDPEELLRFMDNLDSDFRMMTLRGILMKMSCLSKQRIGRLVCSRRYYYVLIPDSLAQQLPLDMRVLLCWSNVYRQRRQKWHTFATSEHIVFDSQKSMQHGAPLLFYLQGKVQK